MCKPNLSLDQLKISEKSEILFDTVFDRQKDHIVYRNWLQLRHIWKKTCIVVSKRLNIFEIRLQTKTWVGNWIRVNGPLEWEKPNGLISGDKTRDSTCVEWLVKWQHEVSKSFLKNFERLLTRWLKKICYS